MRRSNQIDMCNGPLLKNVIIYAVPIIITNLIQLLFNAADLAVVGQFCGSNSVAAVGATTSLVNLFVTFFLGFSLGAGVVMAQAIGSGDKDRIHRVVHTAIPLSLLCGLLVSALSFIFSIPMLRLMETPDEILPFSTTYLRIFSVGMLFNLVYNFGASLLRAAGDSKAPLYILTIAGVVNVVLNVIFVTAFDMDVAGVALATTISQILSAGLVLYVLAARDDSSKFRFNAMRIYFEPLKNMIVIGLPSGVQSAIFSISNVLIQSSINSFGPAAVSGSAAGLNIEGFITVTMNGFEAAAVNFTGQNIGAKKYSRINKILITCTACSMAVGMALGALVFIFKDALLSIYITDSAEAIMYGAQRLTVLTCSFFIVAVLNSLVCALRGMGKAFYAMLANVCCVCGIRVVFVLTLFKYVPFFHTFTWLFIIYPITWVGCILILLPTYLVQIKKLLVSGDGE